MIYDVVRRIKSKPLLRGVEKLLNLVYSPMLRVVSCRERRNLKKKRYYFSICAIFKDEAPYMEEWLEWYRIVGVDHVYLYNNDSSDNFRDILAPYQEEGYVTLIDFPVLHGQLQAYQDCYKRFANETSWLGFFDIDEFLCPLKEVNVRSWLKSYEGYPGVLVHWKMFGTNGYMESDITKLTVERYINSWGGLDGTGKVIISTHEAYSPTRSIYMHHMFFWYRALGLPFKVPVMRESGYFSFFPQLYDSPQKWTMQLNHYWSKSYSEYKCKISKGDVASAENEKIRKKMDFFYLHERHNSSCDYSAYRFLIELKLRLKNKREKAC